MKKLRGNFTKLAIILESWTIYAFFCPNDTESTESKRNKFPRATIKKKQAITGNKTLDQQVFQSFVDARLGTTLLHVIEEEKDEQKTNLHFSGDAVGNLVALLSGGDVGLGQQVRVRRDAVLRLHQLSKSSETVKTELAAL